MYHNDSSSAAFLPCSEGPASKSPFQAVGDLSMFAITALKAFLRVLLERETAIRATS